MTDHRKTQRFDLRLPVEVVKTGSQLISESGQTKNVSSCGVLFTASAEVDIGQPIEYLITLPTGTPVLGGVQLRCVGKVVRRETDALAATMDRYEFVRNRG